MFTSVYHLTFVIKPLFLPFWSVHNISMHCIKKWMSALWLKCSLNMNEKENLRHNSKIRWCKSSVGEMWVTLHEETRECWLSLPQVKTEIRKCIIYLPIFNVISPLKLNHHLLMLFVDMKRLCSYAPKRKAVQSKERPFFIWHSFNNKVIKSGFIPQLFGEKKRQV